MALLIIEGGARAITTLENELGELKLLSGLHSQIMDAPDLDRWDRWHDFLYHLQYYIRTDIPDKLPD